MVDFLQVTDFVGLENGLDLWTPLSKSSQLNYVDADV